MAPKTIRELTPPDPVAGLSLKPLSFLTPSGVSLMNKLSSQDRAALIRLASTMPVGSEERKAILAGLTKKKAAQSGAGEAFQDVVERYLRSSVPECKKCTVNLEFLGHATTILIDFINVENIRDENSYDLLVKGIVKALGGFNVIVEATDGTKIGFGHDMSPGDKITSLEFEVYGA